MNADEDNGNDWFKRENANECNAAAGCKIEIDIARFFA